MSIDDITVVIATFKSGEKIKRCLNSIDRRAKVIIIENSNDSNVKNLEKDYSNVECILAGSNIGYGCANNIGLKKGKTKYALILNPDATPHSSALENFIEATIKIYDFAIMAPYIQEEKDKFDKKNDLKNISPVEVGNVKGFAMFLNISEFREVGFFDENFFFYFEEIDLCKRLINHGKKIYLIPEIKIDHGGGFSHDQSISVEMELSRNWHWMWSTFNYHKKYKGFIVSLFITLPKMSSAIIKVLIYTLIFNKKKKIYYQRLSGLINAIMGKSSWYRPKV